GIEGGGRFDHLSESCAGVLGATLDELWIVARAISARVGGDPGMPGLSGPMEAPRAKPVKTVAVLRTAGFASVVPAAAAALDAFQKKVRSAGIDVLDPDHSAVAAAEDSLSNPRPLPPPLHPP